MLERSLIVAALVSLSCSGGTGGGTSADAGVTLDAAPAPDTGVDAGEEDAGPNPYLRRDAGYDGGIDAGPAGTPAPYPIVLAHGFFGFEDFAGVDFVNYFFGVKDALVADGETQVFTPAVDPFNNSTERGAQLLAHVERILAETGAAKVNLVGHSQGGLDARWVAHHRPELVASVTTISTPHRGSTVADVVLGVSPDGGRFEDIVDNLLRVVGAPIWEASGDETSVFESMRQLSTDGADAFNFDIIDAPSVRYFSVAGRSDLHGGGDICDVDDPPPWIRSYERERDPIEPLLSVTEEILDGGLTAPYPNDGLVRVESAVWGEFLGCIPADHLDQIGHLLGDRPGFGNPWRHTDFYVSLVAFLRAKGF